LEGVISFYLKHVKTAFCIGILSKYAWFYFDSDFRTQTSFERFRFARAIQTRFTPPGSFASKRIWDVLLQEPHTSVTKD